MTKEISHLITKSYGVMYGSDVKDEERAPILFGVLEDWMKRTIGRDVTYVYVTSVPEKRMAQFLFYLQDLNEALYGLSNMEEFAEVVASKVRFAPPLMTRLRGVHANGLVWEPGLMPEPYADVVGSMLIGDRLCVSPHNLRLF